MKLRMCGAVLICIMVLVGAIACSSGVSKAPNGMTASEILARYQNTSASMKTLQMTRTINASAMGQEINASMSMSADKLNRKMYMSQTDFMSTGEMELYILNNWSYISSPTAKAKWVKTPLTEDIWNMAYSVDNQSAVLSNFIDAKYIGMELLGGINCYKINVNPNSAAILDDLGMSELGVNQSDVIIKNCSCTVWIDESTYYPLKTSLNVTLEFENITELANAVLTFSNINQPVNIVLPAAVQNATSISYSQFESGNW